MEQIYHVSMVMTGGLFIIVLTALLFPRSTVDYSLAAIRIFFVVTSL
jgi:hypothetical protein